MCLIQPVQLALMELALIRPGTNVPRGQNRRDGIRHSRHFVPAAGELNFSRDIEIARNTPARLSNAWLPA
jgi:hypothetical protein